MLLGNKISILRKESGLSQKQLADKLGVSRSAIAKWESEKGIPDIENLVIISEYFGKTIDFFLTDNEVVLTELEDEKSKGLENRNEISEEYIGKLCDILLGGWNDGVYDAVIMGDDKDFVFYQVEHKGERYGAISKSCITGVNISKNQKDSKKVGIDKDYFINKHVRIELAKEKGLIKGFFDFKDDDYIDVIINSVENDKLYLRFGQSLLLNQITKIEEI